MSTTEPASRRPKLALLKFPVRPVVPQSIDEPQLEAIVQRLRNLGPDSRRRLLGDIRLLLTHIYHA
jgi:hypothetical protein